jgi:hypothetical protein
MKSRRSIAVALIAREKFGVAQEALERLYESTVPFHLYFVATPYPEPVRREIDRLLAAKDAVTILDVQSYVFPNDALNRVVDSLREEDVLCVVENDVLVEPDSLEIMADTLERHPCDVVSPLILEGRREGLHYDPPISVIERDGESYYSRVERIPRNGHARVHGARVVRHIEKHAFAMTAESARTLAPFEPWLNTREQIEFSLKAFDAGLTIVFEPRSVVRYIAPGELQPQDMEFFRFRWDEERARRSNSYIEKRWNLVDFHRSTTFIQRMNRLGDRAAARAEA